MQIKDLMEFIRVEDKRLRKRFGNYPDEEKRILARAVKLGEETGELFDEILAYNSLQRQEKLKAKNPENLSDEFADVIITTLLLAIATNVDVEKALLAKIDKINHRYENRPSDIRVVS